MTNSEVGAVCPQCGSAAAVHSIQELAALARGQLGQQQGYPAPPQPGYGGEPQAGPVPGYAQQPQAGPVPGYAQQPQSGPVPGSGQGSSPRLSSGFTDYSIGEDIAGMAMGAAARFLGRAITRKVQQAVEQQVMPAVARQQAAMQDQIAIAERYPGLRACLNDNVVFLAGGSRVLPLADAMGGGLPTLAQADAVVARLREG